MTPPKGTSILAIIPARGGSKTLPRKNLRTLLNKPLLAYAIDVAYSSACITRTVVSTDDYEIADTAHRYGAEVVERPPELATDESPSIATYKHVLETLKGQGYTPDVAVILQPTSPLRTVADVDGAIEQYLQGGYDAVVSVCEVDHPPEWMYTLHKGRLVPLLHGAHLVTRRQESKMSYRLNGAVYVVSPRQIMEHSFLLDGDTGAYIMPQCRSVDIDSQLDLELAALLLTAQ